MNREKIRDNARRRATRCLRGGVAALVVVFGTGSGKASRPRPLRDSLVLLGCSLD